MNLCFRIVLIKRPLPAIVFAKVILSKLLYDCECSRFSVFFILLLGASFCLKGTISLWRALVNFVRFAPQTFP